MRICMCASVGNKYPQRGTVGSNERTLIKLVRLIQRFSPTQWGLQKGFPGRSTRRNTHTGFKAKTSVRFSGIKGEKILLGFERESRFFYRRLCYFRLSWMLLLL